MTYLSIEKVGVYNSSFDVIQVSVVLKSSLEETSLLAQLGNMSLVIVSEHLVTKDGISHLKQSVDNKVINPHEQENAETYHFITIVQ